MRLSRRERVPLHIQPDPGLLHFLKAPNVKVQESRFQAGSVNTA